MKRVLWVLIPILLSSLACTREQDPLSEYNGNDLSFAFENLSVQGLVATRVQGGDARELRSDDGVTAFVLAEEMPSMNIPTRASAYNAVSGIPSFRVTAFDHSGSFGPSTTSLSGGRGFENTSFTVTNSGSDYWGAPSSAKYWPISSRRMSFFACVPYNIASLPLGTGFPSFTYAVLDNVANQKDILVASALDQVNTVASQNTPGRAPLTFRHALSAVIFSIGDMGVNSNSGSLTVTLSGLYKQDTFTYSGTSSSSSMGGSWSGSPSGSGTYTFTTNLHGTNSSPVDYSDLSGSNVMFLMPQTIPDGATLSISYTDPGGAVHQFSTQLNGLGIATLSPGGLYKYTISLSNSATLQAAYQKWTDVVDGSIKVDGPVTSYTSGETFGVYAVNSSDKRIVFANVPMTASSNGAVTSLNSGNYYLSDKYTYYVYYPYKADLSLTYKDSGVTLAPGSVIGQDVTGVTTLPTALAFFSNYLYGANGTTAFTPATNQTTLADFKASDLQFGKAGFYEGTFTVEMAHYESLAKIVLQTEDVASTLTIDGRSNLASVSGYTTVNPGSTFNTGSSYVRPYRNGSTNDYYYIAKYNTKPKVAEGTNSTAYTKWAASPVTIQTASSGSLGVGKYREFIIRSKAADRGWINYIANYPYYDEKVAMTFNAPVDGTYKFECWGAQGGGHTENTQSGVNTDLGKGGYTSGQMAVTTSQTFYVYVGESPENKSILSNATVASTRTFNGGGGGPRVAHDPTRRVESHAGGGATDIRTTGGAWNNTTSLNSRIMVAGGGGGASHGGFGGYGGGTSGGIGIRYMDVSGFTYDTARYNIDHDTRGSGGTQSAGGAKGYFDWTVGVAPTAGSWGVGGDGNTAYGGGGGGGYYGGGGAGVHAGSMGGGGGGSSFISGHSGCTTITGYVFTNTSMINGGTSQTQPGGSSTIGHAGDGYARITFVSE